MGQFESLTAQVEEDYKSVMTALAAMRDSVRQTESGIGLVEATMTKMHKTVLKVISHQESVEADIAALNARVEVLERKAS